MELLLALVLLASQCLRTSWAAANLRGAQIASLEAPPRSSESSRFFLWFTDAHVDPYYGTERQQCVKVNASVTRRNLHGTVTCDPPLELWEATVKAAARVAAVSSGVDFALFTGDFTRHLQNLMPDPAVNVTDTIGGVSQTLIEAGIQKNERAPLRHFSVGALGNDDSPLNYYLNITGNSSENPWLTDVAAAFSATGIMSPSSLPSYKYGGFYKQTFGNVTVLTINTVIYSVRHVPRPQGQLPDDPFGQLRWLQGQLEDAASNGNVVWIVGHIPPGMETYSYTELWHSEYLKAYRRLISDPVLGAAVAAQLFGHVHADEIRWLPEAPETMGPILLSGAVSPIFRTNPSFRLVEYEPSTGQLLNYLVYWAELPELSTNITWKLGYSAIQAYEVLQRGLQNKGALQNAAFGELADDLGRAGSTWNTYAGWYKTQYVNDLMYCGKHALVGNTSLQVKQACVASYLCSLKLLTAEEFDTCKARHARPVNRTASVVAFNSNADDFELGRQAHWKTLGQPIQLASQYQIPDTTTTQNEGASSGTTESASHILFLLLVATTLSLSVGQR